MKTALLCGVLWCCVLVRVLSPAAPRGDTASPARPRLPARLDGEPGLVVALSPSERTLATSPRVSLQRRRYGGSEVALLGSTGLKELHPPEVCLRAAGLEIVRRTEEKIASNRCIGWLTVRAGDGREQQFGFVFFDRRTVTCKFWKRAALAAGQQLIGARAHWSTLQILDADAGRARRRLLALLDLIGQGETP